MTRVRLDELMTSTLGEILIQMRAITTEQLEQTLEFQQKLSPEELLGQLLVAQGIIDTKQLELALSAQKGLRSKSKHVRALAMARLAETSGAKIMDMLTKIDSSSQECLQHYGGVRASPILAAKALAHGPGNSGHQK